MSKCQCGCSCVCPCACKHALEDYYWRDYKGIVPEDALSAGENTYIGQVYIQNSGLFIGPITPGAKEIEVSAYGVKKQNYLIKILCTKHKGHFNWVNATSDTFHDDVRDKFAVVGGYDHVKNNGELHIGRVAEGEALNLGGISSFRPKDVYLWYVKENKDFKALSYEVLVYDKCV